MSDEMKKTGIESTDLLNDIYGQLVQVDEFEESIKKNPKKCAGEVMKFLKTLI